MDASTGFQLWSERFDRPFDDAFAIQDEIARAIADALSATLLHDNTGAPRDQIGRAAHESFLRERIGV